MNSESTPFNGLGMSLGSLPRFSRAQTRSISPENFTGEKGKGGMGRGPPTWPTSTRNSAAPTAPFPALPDRDFLEVV